jgi:ABC-2 type transport system permease protein
VVATVLRIRFAILGNVLGSSPWQIVAFIMGAFGALWLIVLAGAGVAVAAGSGPEAVRGAVTLGGAVLTAGWVLGPLIVAGVDTTIDAGRLAPFPISTRQKMLALTAVGLAGVPGIATALGALTTFGAWWRWPAALAAAVVCLPLGVLTCVVASRLVAAIAAAGGRGRRTGEVLGIVAFAAIILAGPIVAGIGNLAGAATRGDVGRQLGAAVTAVSWTPIGAAWAVPGDLAADEPLAAGGKLLIALATLAALWLLWRHRLTLSPGATAERRPARVRAGRLGWFGTMPSTPLGATWARALTYWLHDPRYLRQLLIVPLLPIVIAFAGQGSLSSSFFAFSSAFVALILGFVPYADVSYDGTAFTGIVAAGVRGRTDRAGRLLAAGSIAVPAIVAVAIVTVGVAGDWTRLPAVIGAALGVLFVAYGVSAGSSALLVVPVPASGDNPFKRVPGTTFTAGIAVFGVLVGTAVLGAPAVVASALLLAGGDPAMGWVALAVGVVYGLAVAIAGALIGGRVFDRTAPALLARLRALNGI